MDCTSITYTNCGTLISAVKASTEAFHKRLKQLYPCVDDISKLPQSWSSESKAAPLGLTYDNLGCYFRGNPRREEDDKFAAAVRTDHYIPPSCLIYYFEIKFLSKGREGFMGLGLTSAQAALSKLPGWARESYGYHADDGNIFNGDGRGNPFGPTFTTGDVVGCGYNLVEGKCFFTKNGLNLGKAFDDIPSNIQFYPTIGLKTPGEEIKANFGQENFVYDIEQDLRSLRKNMTLTISNYQISDFGNWQNTLHKLVQSWLLQNSYPNTAEAFTRSSRIECKENMQRIQQRNRIQQLVLNGKISEAIKLTNRLCPNLLQGNPNLLFALKCRQFVELISGAENDFQPIFNYATVNSTDNNNSNGVSKIDTNGDQPAQLASTATCSPMDAAGTTNTSDITSHISNSGSSTSSSNNNNNCGNSNSGNATTTNNGCNGLESGNNNCEKIHDQQLASSSSLQELMDIDQPINSSALNANNHNNGGNQNYHHRNSSTNSNSNNLNNPSIAQLQQQQQSIPPQPPQNVEALGNPLNGSDQVTPIEDTEIDLNEQKFAKLILFGRELNDYLQQLNKLYGKNEMNERMLQDAIGLIAFINPENSRFGKLLDPSEREPISQLLNSSILRAEMGETHRLPLEEMMGHLHKLVQLNDSYGKWLMDRLY